MEFIIAGLSIIVIYTARAIFTPPTRVMPV
jgi:hypothetical protein